MFGSTIRKGTVVADEVMVDLYPKINKSDRSGVIFYHGAGSTATYLLDAAPANQADLTQRVSSRWPGISGGYGGDSWGAPAANAKAESYLARMRSRAGGSADDFSAIGASMGGLTGFNQARNTSGIKPTAIVMVIPVINLADIVDNNRGGFAGAVNTAFGGAYNEAASGATCNPYTYRADASIAGIPMLIFYGLTDAICLPAFTEAFIDADPDNRIGVPLASGHDYASYNAVDHGLIIDFLQQHQLTS
jgi:hypothetical protein